MLPRTLQGLENLQEWRLHNFSEQSVPLPCFPHSEKVSPYLHSKSPVFQFMCLLLCSCLALLGIACLCLLNKILAGVGGLLLSPCEISSPG